MNAIYAACAYPFGRLSDRVPHATLLGMGVVVLLAADLVLARNTGWVALFVGVALWGVHMGMTQGLLAAMVADTSPAPLRGTAFGVFNLASGVAMLVASTVAGVLWQVWGAPSTFYAGALFCLVSLVALACQRALGAAPCSDGTGSKH
jgi:MFS family permease